MSLGAAILVSLVRAAGVALLACALAGQLRVTLAHARRRRRLSATLLLIAVVPPLLVGYGWSTFSHSLVRVPLAKEALHAALLVLRLTPITLVALLLVPAPARSAAARRCRELVPRPRREDRFARWVHGLLPRYAVAFTVTFLLAFQDFELAALLGASAWTVRLFDAQVGGLSLSSALTSGLLPLLLQAVILAAALGLLLRLPRSGEREAPPPSRRARWITTGYVGLALTGICLVPAIVVGREALPGLRALLSPPLARELAASALFAGTAASCAWLLTGTAVRSARLRPGRALLLAIPGLFGALLLGLAVQGTFQTPGLRALYDTALPLALALTLLLLPVALLLRVGLAHVSHRSAVHAARLLPATRRRDLLWTLEGKLHLGAAVLLFVHAFFELLASAMLAPTGMTPAPVRLYNLMHYGHSALLSAMVAATVAAALLVPLLAVAAGATRRRWLARG